MKNKRNKIFWVIAAYFSALVLLAGCGPVPINDDGGNADAKPIALSEFQTKYGFTLRNDQNGADVKPPQANAVVQGKVVKLNGIGDLPWTAFTIVLYPQGQGFKILTQKRASHMTHGGTIETAGGHLVPNNTWRDGARVELEQEAGIRIDNRFLGLLQDTQPYLNFKKKLVGNFNFLAIFDKQPKTTNSNKELDKAYGHQWLDLKKTYQDVKAEQNNLNAKGRGRDSGKYYTFFRGHLIHLCTQVINCDNLP